MTKDEVIAELKKTIAAQEKTIERLAKQSRDISRGAVEARDYAYKTIGALLYWADEAGSNLSVSDQVVAEIRAIRSPAKKTRKQAK